jgi:porphobilinogen synthase
MKKKIHLIHRPRRLRQSRLIRELVQETRLHPSNLVMPIFIKSGNNIKNPIQSMPGQFQYSIDQALIVIKKWISKGVHSILLFAIPQNKDFQGSDALSENGIAAKAIRIIKNTFPDLYLISDICFCEYTDHGHCGVVVNNELDNDATLPLIAKQALIHARSGVDLLAPSGMVDGMVYFIREALDQEGFSNNPIMSYSVKYNSAFYGPFREAVQSTPKFGDRRGYQMNPANAQEALREAKLDIEQGVDILMVKPALLYLDIIKMLSQHFTLPIAAYQVSGEYAAIKIAAQAGVLDERLAILESLLAIKRSGASLLISYFTESIIDKL